MKSAFAQQQLIKHGWIEGKGLGKEESGITEAIKVKIKHDSHGVGHNPGEQFTYHWWDHLFNKAAKKISVDQSQTIQKVEEETNEKTKQKQRLYGQFVKGATLCGEKYEAVQKDDDSSDESDDEKEVIGRADKLTDEELLKACGGLTGHKAARHGHKLNGKLARLQEQERLTLEPKGQKSKSTLNENTNKLNSSSSSKSLEVDTESESITTDKKKKRKKEKKKKKCYSDNEDITDGVQNDSNLINSNTTCMESESRKRHSAEIAEEGEFVMKQKKKKSKKSKKERKEESVCDAVDVSVTVQDKDKMTSLNHGHGESEHSSGEHGAADYESEEVRGHKNNCRKKRKKSKDRETESDSKDVSVDDCSPKKKKKKRKKDKN